MIPATLDQDLIFCLDGDSVLRRLVGKREYQLAFLDAKLPAPRTFLGVGASNNDSVWLLLDLWTPVAASPDAARTQR